MLLFFFFQTLSGNPWSPRVLIHKESVLQILSLSALAGSLLESHVGILVSEPHNISWIQLHLGKFSITLVTLTIFHFIIMQQNSSTCFAFQNVNLLKNQRKSRCASLIDGIESPTQKQASKSKQRLQSTGQHQKNWRPSMEAHLGWTDRYLFIKWLLNLSNWMLDRNEARITLLI